MSYHYEAEQILRERRGEKCMREVKLLPGLYSVGRDIPEGAYVLSLSSESEYANVALVKLVEYSWFMRAPFNQIHLRLEKNDVFRLDRPVMIRSAEPMDVGYGNV